MKYYAKIEDNVVSNTIKANDDFDITILEGTYVEYNLSDHVGIGSEYNGSFIYEEAPPKPLDEKNYKLENNVWVEIIE
jgi:hypothetical protein